MSGTGRIFEWDERKRRSNLRKHGLDFADCAAVFSGLTLTSVDGRIEYMEVRFRTLGLLRGRVVHVAHTDEEDGLIRVISLRKATKYEEAYYFKTFQN